MGENAMGGTSLVCLILAIGIAAGCNRRTPVATPSPSPYPTPSSAPESPSGANLDSGVYGFAGARIAEGSQEGVIGECIWVFDESDARQIAKGECAAAEPGRFRLPLQPGKYVIHGPGGNHPIEVKRGQWTQVTSLVNLPLAP